MYIKLAFLMSEQISSSWHRMMANDESLVFSQWWDFLFIQMKSTVKQIGSEPFISFKSMRKKYKKDTTNFWDNAWYDENITCEVWNEFRDDKKNQKYQKIEINPNAETNEWMNVEFSENICYLRCHFTKTKINSSVHSNDEFYHRHSQITLNCIFHSYYLCLCLCMKLLRGLSNKTCPSSIF